MGQFALYILGVRRRAPPDLLCATDPALFSDNDVGRADGAVRAAMLGVGYLIGQSTFAGASAQRAGSRLFWWLRPIFVTWVTPSPRSRLAYQMCTISRKNLPTMAEQAHGWPPERMHH